MDQARKYLNSFLPVTQVPQKDRATGFMRCELLLVFFKNQYQTSLCLGLIPRVPWLRRTHTRCWVHVMSPQQKTKFCSTPPPIFKGQFVFCKHVQLSKSVLKLKLFHCLVSRSVPRTCSKRIPWLPRHQLAFPPGPGAVSRTDPPPQPALASQVECRFPGRYTVLCRSTRNL